MKRKCRVKTSLLVLAAAAWALTLVIGLGWLWSYESIPGAPGHAPSSWPIGSKLPLERGKLNLLMFAHPHCPCSRASIAELAHVMTRAGDRIFARVIFVQPEGAPTDFSQSSLRRDASAIPGVRVVDDPRGAEAARFGSSTSGDVRVFDGDGALLFSGGITPSRGHEGASAGRDVLLSLITTDVGRQSSLPIAQHTSVYGCPLFDSSAPHPGGNSCQH